MRTMPMLVELVELHQVTTVFLVKVEGFLHIFHSLFLAVLLVEACEGKVSPYGWETGVELCRAFPVFDGDVVLPLVVI